MATSDKGSNMNNIDELPKWPEPLPSGQLREWSDIQDDYNRNLIAALRARLEMFSSMIEEYIDQPDDPRWYWTDEKWREVITACKEPS